LSDWCDDSTIDNGFLDSTNNPWVLDDTGVYNSYDESTWLDGIDVIESSGNSSSIQSAFEFQHDDPLDVLPLSDFVGDNTLDSTLGFGNSDSVPYVSIDTHINPDYDSSHDEHQSFSLDDYINYQPDLSSLAAEIRTAMSNTLQPSSFPIPDSLPTCQSSTSSLSPLDLVYGQDSTDASPQGRTSTTSQSLSPAPTSKLPLSPASYSKCPLCQKTLTSESRRRSHAHRRFPCTFEGCKSTFTEARAVTRHMKSVHEKRVFGECCGRTFSRKDKYDIHARRCPITRNGESIG